MALPPPQLQSSNSQSELEGLIVACARDERPALARLYELTAPRLYALASAHAGSAEGAAQALIATYLEAFALAASFAPGDQPPLAWLDAILARHLPDLPPASATAHIQPLDPPPELWQRLDIALGLQRLDRHIKPGVASVQRGRDPMPNAYDRSIERQLAFWRTAGLAAMAVIIAAAGALAVPDVRAGAAALLAASSGAGGALAAQLSAPPRAAILRPNGESRVWRIALLEDGFDVEAFPAFEHRGQGVLTLWATPAGGQRPVRLGRLDPATATRIAMPADLDAETLALAITLEPDGSGDAAMPAGRTLFAGRLAP